MKQDFIMEKNQIENDVEEEIEVCEYCNGEGEVIATEKIHSRIIDVPYKKCPECNGTGIK